MNYLLVSDQCRPSESTLTIEKGDYNKLVPFTLEEIQDAKRTQKLFGHLYHEVTDEFLLNRCFVYLSSMIL